MQSLVPHLLTEMFLVNPEHDFSKYCIEKTSLEPLLISLIALKHEHSTGWLKWCFVERPTSQMSFASDKTRSAKSILCSLRTLTLNSPISNAYLITQSNLGWFLGESPKTLPAQEVIRCLKPSYAHNEMQSVELCTEWDLIHVKVVATMSKWVIRAASLKIQCLAS